MKYWIFLLIPMQAVAQSWLEQVRLLATSRSNTAKVVDQLDKAFAQHCRYSYSTHSSDTLKEMIILRERSCLSDLQVCLSPPKHWAECLCDLKKSQVDQFLPWWDSYLRFIKKGEKLNFALKEYEACGYQPETTRQLVPTFLAADPDDRSAEVLKLTQWALTEMPASSSKLEVRMELLNYLFFEYPQSLSVAKALNEAHEALLRAYSRQADHNKQFWARHLSENLLHQNSVLGDYQGVVDYPLNISALKAFPQYLLRTFSDRCLAAINLGQYSICQDLVKQVEPHLRKKDAPGLDIEKATLYFALGETKKADELLKNAEVRSFWVVFLRAKVNLFLGKMSHAKEDLRVLQRQVGTRKDRLFFLLLERARQARWRGELGVAKKELKEAFQLANSVIQGEGNFWRFWVREEAYLAFLERDKPRFQELYGKISGDKNLKAWIPFFKVLQDYLHGSPDYARSYQDFIRKFKASSAADIELRRLLSYKPKTSQ